MSEEWGTIPRMVLDQALRRGAQTVFRVKKRGKYTDVSWAELQENVTKTALALIDAGVKSGDRVAILSENRPEWAYADLAALAAGAVTVPVYTTLSSVEIEHILQDSQARFLFVSNTQLMSKVLDIQEKLGLKIVLFDAPYRVKGPRVWWIGEFMGLGQTAGLPAQKILEQRLQDGKPGDLASLIYTSGTTGLPKGVMLTHQNFLSNCQAIHQILAISDQDETLSFLPLSHVFERTAGYYFVLFVGAKISYAENLDSVPIDVLRIRPTLITGVPRFYEKIQEKDPEGRAEFYRPEEANHEMGDANRTEPN